MTAVFAASVFAVQIAHSGTETSLFDTGNQDPSVLVETAEVAVVFDLEGASSTLRVTRSARDRFTEVFLMDLEAVGFWGLEITDPEQLKDFLANRVFQCAVIQSIEDIAQLDCYAALRANPGLIENGMTEGWISAFDWLPEFGLARRVCSKAYEARAFDWENTGRIHYSCIDGMYPARGQMMHVGSSTPH